ncbi:hypothetical protein SAY87_021882 [Trapa incisa]|uniref:Uncharacterized protein n=1 Tax=Trapa incisa TaxID=236973 RepID=A0AAN7JSI8_9MYRT|nr:hypothetical protein SAY87_021882 [Trapa incisa]
MPLNEEKLMLRLKQSPEQLTANMGNWEEFEEALEQKEQTEERLKVLRKELESLRGNVTRAEVITKAAKKKHYDGNVKFQELQAKFRAADAVRQTANNHLRSLRIQLKEKEEEKARIEELRREEEARLKEQSQLEEKAKAQLVRGKSGRPRGPKQELQPSTKRSRTEGKGERGEVEEE